MPLNKINESFDRYAEMYELAPVGFVTLTTSGQIDKINLTGAKWLGVERDKLKQRRFDSFITAVDRDRWRQIFQHTLKHDGHRSCELMLKRKDGCTFHILVDGLRPVTIGNETFMDFAFMDVTERYNNHAAEQRMRHILDNTLDMIFIFTPDTLRFVYMNKGVVRTLRFSREELLEMTPLDILNLSSESEFWSYVFPLVDGSQETLGLETTVVQKNGSHLPVEARLQLVQEQDGSRMFVAILRDISERKQAERELRRQKNLMWQVIDSDPNTIFVKDKYGKYILANQAMADFYNTTVPQLIGKTDRELNRHIKEVKQFEDADRSVIENRQELSLIEMLNKGGKECWYYTVKRPLTQPDDSTNVLGIAMDITDLKQSERKLAESYRELQQLSLHLENIRAEERAQIGRNLHDEMGAVLATLKMRITWLASRLPKDMPELHVEIERISELVADGVRMVRQVASDLRPNLLHDVGLIEATRNYVRKFQRDTETQCVFSSTATNIELNENQTVTVFRIIQESLNNIAKHAKASKVTVSLNLENGQLLMQIQDDGIGFDPGKKMKSFGLLGIKERALMIGGSAEIDSARGLGSVVKLSLPLNDKGQVEFDYS